MRLHVRGQSRISEIVKRGFSQVVCREEENQRMSCKDSVSRSRPSSSCALQVQAHRHIEDCCEEVLTCLVCNDMYSLHQLAQPWSRFEPRSFAVRHFAIFLRCVDLMDGAYKSSLRSWPDWRVLSPRSVLWALRLCRPCCGSFSWSCCCDGMKLSRHLLEIEALQLQGLSSILLLCPPQLLWPPTQRDVWPRAG